MMQRKEVENPVVGEMYRTITRSTCCFLGDRAPTPEWAWFDRRATPVPGPPSAPPDPKPGIVCYNCGEEHYARSGMNRNPGGQINSPPRLGS